MFNKASDGLNLMITNKIKSLDLIDSLTDLENIRRDRKNNNNERLEVKKIEDMIRKVSDGFKAEKTDELKWKLRFVTLTIDLLNN